MRTLLIIMATAIVILIFIPEVIYANEAFCLYGYLLNYFQSSFIYNNARFKESTYGDTLLLRLKGDWSPEDKLSFHAEAAYYCRLGNQNPYAFYDNLGLSHLPQDQFPYNDFVNEIVIDHAWGLANLGPMDLQFGKIPIAWGSGYVFNPTAKTAPVQFLDPVSEETPGTFGIVPSFYIGDVVTLTGYLAFQDRSHKTYALKEDGDIRNLPFGIKVQVITGLFDISAGIIKEVLYAQESFQRAYYLSVDLDGGIQNLGLYTETGIYLPVEQSRLSFKGYNLEENLEITTGCYYTLVALDTELRLEYYHQGQGESKKSKYDILRVLTQEQLMLAEDYLFIFFERSFTDYIRASAGSLFNLNDGSFVVYPEFSWDVYSNFQFSLGSFFFFGGKGSEFKGEHYIEDVGNVDITETFSLYTRVKISF